MIDSLNFSSGIPRSLEMNGNEGTSYDSRDENDEDSLTDHIGSESSANNYFSDHCDSQSDSYYGSEADDYYGSELHNHFGSEPQDYYGNESHDYYDDGPNDYYDDGPDDGCDSYYDY